MHNNEERGCALVTGSARGIGAAIAERLAQDGMNVVINCSSEGSRGRADELAARLAADYVVEALVVVANIAKFDEAKALVDAAIAQFGKIWVLVNNAGITRDGLLMRMKEDQFSDVVDVDLKGVFNVMRHACGPMMKARAGRIINISSVSGILGNAGQCNYSAAKAGVIGLTKAAAREMAPRGITVNAIAPGFVRTAMTEAMKPEILEAACQQIPLGRMAEVEDIAAAAAFLASDAAAYITGQTIQVDGGLAIG